MPDAKARQRFFREITKPVIIAAIVLTALVGSLILWSTHYSDRIAVARQEALIANVIRQGIETIAHDQEASTVWNDAYRAIRKRPLDLNWMDDNLGIWMFEYYGHDRIYVLDDVGSPIYAMVNGARSDPRQYRRLASIIAPLADELRAKMDTPIPPSEDTRMLSHGVADLATIEGRPAIISVKPILPEDAELRGRPDKEYLHVAIRYLDGSFATRIANRFWLDKGHITLHPQPNSDEAEVVIRDRAGNPVGYFYWESFRPGRIVLGQIAPTLITVLLILLAGTAMLLRKLLSSMMALHSSEIQAQHLAFHDTLTGLANRALFESRLDTMLNDLDGGGPSIALLYLDLDRFKAVNDTQGHAAGDQLIRMVGERLLESTRTSDVVARLGGDEFAVILHGIRSDADIEQSCQRIAEAINEPFNLNGGNANIGVSIGVAVAPRDGIDRAELSRKADIALYRAKAGGRNRFTLFAKEMDEHIRLRQAIERDLRAALAGRGQLQLHYQPIISTSSGEISGVEALVRWSRSGYGPIGPHQFIPIAEESGLIEPLGEWVLRQACAEAAHWPLDVVSINISPLQLRTPGFAGRMLQIIDEAGLDPHRLEFEITETCLIDDAAECQPNISALRERGVRFALDDFGTGYSSFNHFRQLKVDRLKIDRSFVSAITPANPDSVIIKAIVDLAISAGIEVTAEGVETQEQSRYLTRIGCSSMQGWLFGQPVPAASISDLLRPRVVKLARG